jgi:hypothetical protein
LLASHITGQKSVEQPASSRSFECLPEPSDSPPTVPAQPNLIAPQFAPPVVWRRFGSQLEPFIEYTIFPAPNEMCLMSVQLWIPYLVPTFPVPSSPFGLPLPYYYAMPVQQDPITFRDSLAYEEHLRNHLWPRMFNLHPAFRDYMNIYIWPHLDGHHQHYVQGVGLNGQHPDLKAGDWPAGFLPWLAPVPSSSRQLHWFADVKPMKKYRHRNLGKFMDDYEPSSHTMSRSENLSFTPHRRGSIATSTPDTAPALSTQGLSVDSAGRLAELRSMWISRHPPIGPA